MATYAERKAAQATNMAATSVPKRIAFIVFGATTGFAVCVGMNYLLSGEPRIGFAIVATLGMTGVLAYHYLVVPSRS